MTLFTAAPRYYDDLHKLASGKCKTFLFSPHTCPNCLERACDHAPDAKGLCWYCKDPKRTPVLHNTNIDLDLDPTREGIDVSVKAAREEWAALRSEFGELR